MPDIHNNDPIDNFKKEIERNSPDHSNEFALDDISANRAVAAASYIPVLFILPLILRPDSKFGRFHANQGLLLFLADAILGTARGGIGILPVVPWVLNPLIGLITLAYFLYGFINALNGKAKELPFIGKIQIIR